MTLLRRRRRRERGGGRWFLLLAFLLGCAVLYLNLGGPAIPLAEVTRKVRIPEGASVEEIAQILKRERIIRSTIAFRTIALLEGSSRVLRSGTYLLRSSQPLSEILAELRAGRSQEVRVTVPEGFTVIDIDQLLARMGLIDSGEVVACATSGCDFSSFTFLPRPSGTVRGGSAERGVGSVLEGYLFPETYYVEVESFVPKFFLERLLTEFQHRVVEGLAADLRSSRRSLRDIITMASLIEEETRSEEERPVVAGILWKRFDAGVGLDVDATVRYALGKPRAPLTAEELAYESAYNTRRYRGLPPGPIANPGLSSIRAALHPVDSPYWYYLHDRAGGIHYAGTNEEHNENKARYLR